MILVRHRGSQKWEFLHVNNSLAVFPLSGVSCPMSLLSVFSSLFSLFSAVDGMDAGAADVSACPFHVILSASAAHKNSLPSRRHRSG